jgi:hypothetical protein
MKTDDPKELAERLMEIYNSPTMKQMRDLYAGGMPCPCESDPNEKPQTFAEISKQGLESMDKDKTLGENLWKDIDE